MTERNRTDRRRASNTVKNDALTGILNKGECIRLLNEQISLGGTVFMLDFDDMGAINERFGKSVGDDVLKEFAQDLKRLCRDTDVIGRIGGDEFLVFMPQQQLTESEIRSVAKRFRKCIKERLVYGKLGGSVQKGAKVGVIVAPVSKYNSYSEVMSVLSEALYSSENVQSEEIVVNSEKNYVYTEVFPTKVRNALSPQEIQETLKALNKAFFGTLFIRLNDMSYVRLREYVKRETDESDTRNAMEYVKDGIYRYVSEEYRSTMVTFGDLTTLADRMKDTDSIQSEYQDPELGWCVARFVAVSRVNGELSEVLLLLSNISDAKEKEKKQLLVQKKANELLTNSELLFVGLINPDTGATVVELSLKNPDSVGQVKDYKRSMTLEVKYVVDVERDSFLKQTSLETVKQILKTEKRYTVSAILKNPKRERHLIRYHFSRFNEHILCATEDATEQLSYDELTGYYNFLGFRLYARTLMEKEGAENFAVLNFNISNFKAINNFYSFETGNWLLGEVARQIKESVLNIQVLCRENADNFFALCRKSDLDYETLEKLCHMEVSGADGTKDNLQLFCGIYLCGKEHELIQIMCDKARLARNHAEKECGVDILTFNEKTQAQYLDSASILADIPRAIRNKELEVYYQPIFDAKTAKVASAEALVRWNHPEKGFLSPGVFIPAIEKTEQIAEVDLYVARRVKEDLEKRIAENKCPIPVSVNMSRYDFLRETNLDEMRRLLSEHPEQAEYLRIEITESGFINIPSGGELFIREMQRLGVKTMIDDFGTGFSSLASITEHPCDMIKLDMSFASQITSNPKMEKIIIAVIHTAHELGITVVAEGVETKAQYEFLRDHDCDYIQGYYFSKPIPRKELEALLED